MKILVVGLNPSRKGSKSPTIRNLYVWLDKLEIQYVSFVNLYDSYQIDRKKPNATFIKEISKDYRKIISLGVCVDCALDDLGIYHFALPHPSGLNRQLNNLKYVEERLESCKTYLNR